MAQCTVELDLAVDKWEMGFGSMFLGWEGWVVERDHGLSAPFSLLYCLKKLLHHRPLGGADAAHRVA